MWSSTTGSVRRPRRDPRRRQHRPSFEVLVRKPASVAAVIHQSRTGETGLHEEMAGHFVVQSGSATLVFGGKLGVIGPLGRANIPPITELLSDFFVSIQEIETRTGLDFFAALDDQQEQLIESRRQPWPVSRP
ncbi:MAG: hypothetical protein JNL98_26695 [Bryobacterales bacterium]|nr:hypothetical protein [Bryobacterales bacterium]